MPVKRHQPSLKMKMLLNSCVALLKEKEIAMFGP
jgi:hypothetical protein